MDPEELKLRRAILRDPADDTVRLAFADYLAENAPTETCWQCSGTGGKEWHDATHGAVDGPCGTCRGSGRLSAAADYADFIRKSCRVAEIRRMCGCTGCVKRRGGGQGTNGPCGVDSRDDAGVRHDYRRTLHDLMQAGEQAQQWFAVPGLGVQLDFTMDRLNWWVQPSGPRIEAELERGFVRRVKCPAADWLKFTDALTERQPITDVELTTEIDYYGTMGDELWLYQRPDESNTPRHRRLCKTATWGCWYGAALDPGKYAVDVALQAEWPGVKITHPRGT